MRLLLLIATLLLTACTGGEGAVTMPSPAQSCHASGALPDPTCTPGATNPDVTQATIGQTICNPNWHTSSIRPPVSYTEPLKIKQIAQYGYADTKPQDYEEDHLIPLEVGGDPRSPLNLWPEAHNPTPGSLQKDGLENYLRVQVCSGAMTLADAQHAIATDWLSAWQQAGQP